MVETDEATVTCLGCGRVMAPPRGRMMVCSNACAQRVWRARRRAARRRQVCATCDQAFIPARSDARYCCSACKLSAYRQRKAAGRAVDWKLYTIADRQGPIELASFWDVATAAAAPEPAERTVGVKIDVRALIG